MRQAAIVAATIVVSGIFIAIVGATGAGTTVTMLGLIAILVVAGITSVAVAPASRPARSLPIAD